MIERIWQRIIALEGSTFRQLRGREFAYRAHATYLELDRTNHNVPRNHIEQAVKRMPLSGPGQLSDLRAPSYIYAIIMDPRVRRDDY